MAVTIVLEEEPYRLITDGDEHYAVIEARDGLVYSLHSHDRHEAPDTAEGMAEVVGDGDRGGHRCGCDLRIARTA